MPFFLTVDPKTGIKKNKVEKPGIFLAAEKAPHKTPQVPRIPPQTHHTFTTAKRQKNAKPPQNHRSFLTKYLTKYFPKNKPRSSGFRHQSR